MKSYQRWIWQLPEWPSLVFDAQQIQTRLSEARKTQGLLLGRAEMIGLEGLQPHIRDSLTQEALTTSAIEGEKLDPESVRSSVARRLGLGTSGAPLAEGKRNIEGLIDVLQDATLNTDSALTLERLCNWHGALFPTGFSGMQRIDVGALRSVPMEIVSGAIGHTKVHYAAPPAEGLAAQVDAFLTWFNQTHPSNGSQPMDGLVRAAVAHLWFETLHPFDVITAITGKDLGISTMRVRKLFAQETKFESNKLAATGFKSAVSIREGISRMVKWWKQAGSKAVPKWRQPPSAVQRFHP